MNTNPNSRFKKILFFLFLILGSANFTFAQAEKFNYNGHLMALNNKVIDNYGIEYVADLKANDPALLLYLNYFVENGYTIQDIGEKVSAPEIKNISTLVRSEKSKAPAFDQSNLSGFNILAFNIQLTNDQQVFKTGNGKKAIIVVSKQNFLKKFNAYKETLAKQ